MFKKKVSSELIDDLKNKLSALGAEAEQVTDAPVKEYMIKWMGAFAPDVNVYDAKSFCLPKMFFKNYLWNAFSFQKTDCYMDEYATEAFAGGFEGPVLVLYNSENLLFRIADGTVLEPENVKTLGNVVIFTEDFERTYVNTGSEEFGPYYKTREMALSDESIDDVDPDALAEELAVDGDECECDCEGECTCGSEEE